MPDQDGIKKMLKRQREDEERRHQELLEELRRGRGDETSFDPRSKMRRGFEEAAAQDRQARKAGARTPRELREARKRADRG